MRRPLARGRRARSARAGHARVGRSPRHRPGEARGDRSVTQYYGLSTATLDLIPTERGGLKDPKIRKALALDRTGIAKSGYGGFVEPWASPVGSGSWGYATTEFAAAQKESAATSPASPDADDIAEAKRVVKEAGAPTEPIVIGTDATQGRTVVANAARAALQLIGLKGTIKTVPSAQFEKFYSDPQARAEIDVLVADWYISKSDPMGFYDNGLSDWSNNWVGYKDATYDEKVRQALGTVDDAERATLAIDVQKLFADAAVWIPVAQVPSVLVLSDKLTGPPASQAYLYYPWAAGLPDSWPRSSPPRSSSSPPCTRRPAIPPSSRPTAATSSPPNGSRPSAPNTTSRRLARHRRGVRFGQDDRGPDARRVGAPRLGHGRGRRPRTGSPDPTPPEHGQRSSPSNGASVGTSSPSWTGTTWSCSRESGSPRSG